MKNYLFVLFIVLVFSSLVFAAVPTMDDVGGSNTSGGGASSQGVQAEENIYLRANTSDVTAGHNLTSVSHNGSTLGNIYIYYWSQIPNGSYTGYLDFAQLSISNFTNSSNNYCTFDVTLPSESSIPGGTTHISFYLGLVQVNIPPPPFINDFGDLEASEIQVTTAPTNYYTYMTYTADTTTETPTMVLPADNQHDDNPTGIEFSLPEAGYDGSVKLSFTRTGEDHECTIVSEAQGTHSFNIDPTDLVSASSISSVTGGNSLTANVAYTVTIEYQDALQNPLASDSNTGYVYDTVTQTPTLDLPATDAVISTKPFTVQFDQPETALATSVKIIFTRTGGNPDGNSPHTLTVTSEASGNNKTVSIDGDNFANNTGTDPAAGNLVSGTIYTVKIQYQDELSNPVTYDENTNIEYSYGDPIVFASGGDYGDASFLPNSDNNAMFRLQLYWNNSGLQPTVTSIRFDIIGTYSSSDVKTNGMKLWQSADNSFNAGSDTQIGSSMDIADPLTFSGLSETIPVSPGYYYFVTVDVSATAEGSDEIGAEVDQASHITTTATVSGTFPISGSTHPLPVTLSDFSVQFVGGHPTVLWTTQSETNNMGWNIYRSISQNMGQAIHVNAGDPIPGQGTVTEPTDYEYVDMHSVEENTTYYYWLESIETSGETELFGPISLTIPEGGGNFGTPATPDDYGLKQNYPNPFNPDTEIRFALEEASYTRLTIYNIKGEKVKTIFEGYVTADIIQTAVWNSKDESGKDVASGIYLYKLATKHDTFVKKMLLAK
ncbi:MAG: T9SS type A sorting domain-containing protein [Candidatus Cloacimonetes bacterium]|nr:T9SS type A sorting domain-containing protein [Candidatus Cloacimonadota bacterium]